MFALRFATRLEEGAKPLNAMRDACDALDERDANADEKTLQGWLCREFNVKKWTTSAHEWNAACRRHYRFFWDFLRQNSEIISRDSSVLPAEDRSYLLPSQFKTEGAHDGSQARSDRRLHAGARIRGRAGHQARNAAEET
jgi:hypothetical protein